MEKSMVKSCLQEFSDFTRVLSPVKVLCNGPQAYLMNPVIWLVKSEVLFQLQWNLLITGTLGPWKLPRYIRVKKLRNIKSWDQQNYFIIRGFCFIRALYKEVPLYLSLTCPKYLIPNYAQGIVIFRRNSNMFTCKTFIVRTQSRFTSSCNIDAHLFHWVSTACNSLWHNNGSEHW